jgi:hypothetical protein
MSQLRGTAGDTGANHQLTIGAVKAPRRAFVVTQTVKTVR